MQIQTIRKEFEAFENYSKDSKSNSNLSKGIRSIYMQFRTIRKLFQGFKIKF